MAETPSSVTPAPTPTTGSDPDYWCYHCDKRVIVETLPDLPDVICNDCKNGFVESIPSRAAAPITPPLSDQIDDPAFGNQFIQVLRLIAEAARDNDAPPPPPSEHGADPSDDDYLRVELDGWGNDDDDDDDDDVEEEDNGVEVTGENRRNRSFSENEDDDDENDGGDGGDDDDDVDEEEEGNENNDDEEDLRRRRRDVLRLRLRDFASRAANRRNRILDWAEILMGLEDHSIELRLQVPGDVDGYIGNPGDYVDAAGYEALLQTLAESDGSGRRGAPPASKSAVEALDTLVIKEEQEVMGCAICKDVVNFGEMAKKLPCGHGYHGDCIVQWLGTRNSCPVCRFELPTDDPEYEEDRKKRGGICSTSTGSSSSGGAGANATAAATDDDDPSCL